MGDNDYDALYDGLQIEDDLVVKATLRVAARPLRNAVTQSLSVEMTAKYEARMDALMSDIQTVLKEDEAPIAKSEIFFSNGRMLFKAITPSGPKVPNLPKPQAAPKPSSQPKSATSGERKLTPDGYVHVQDPGTRGGKFWRDDKGNVRYGERPHGHFNIPASPEHVVEHYRQYYAPTPFVAHTQTELREALSESEVLSEGDRAFMQWWNDNYDDVLSCLGTNRKEVDKAKGLENLSFESTDGRNIGFGEAIEEFFRANSSNFVGDPTYGDIESPEDILKAVRGLMDRYRQALHEDPKVQAAASAAAGKKEAERSAYFVKAEQMEQEFSPLAGDLVTLEDINDLTARFTVAMFQMGLVERGGKGKVSQKRMRGAIVPKSALLTKGVAGSLHGNDQLDRLGAAQLMALHLASDMQDSFASDNTYDYEEGAPNDLKAQAFDILANKLGINEDDVAKVTLKRKLSKMAETTAQAFTNYNTAQDPHFADLFKMKVKDVAGSENNVMEEYRKKAAQEQSRIEKILKAQEDPTFEPPPTMLDGVWNGKTLKDPEHPEWQQQV